MRTCLPLIIVVLFGCRNSTIPERELFSNVTQSSGVDFNNNLFFTEELNPYTFRNFYNGAGVAIGDINNDGLLDIYFSGNQVDNRLYLNRGNMTFEDITEKAGVGCSGVWSTGVTFVDINADGLLDIYVCKSGNPNALNRHNELFINNGDLTFSEQAQAYGLDFVGLSVQAAFFDYDKDGDLDCYLLTNSLKSVGNYDLIKDQRNFPDPEGGGNKFLLNDNGVFIDYSEDVGIYRSNIGFGLGVTIGDFNFDSWPDIFISNDFFERDYLYINNQKGGFTEELSAYFNSISMGSMGADYADLDNDGFAELFVTEMLPDSLSRRKTKTLYENWDKYQWNIKNDYHYQFPRNVLQKRLDNGQYVEIGRYASVAASEWSWGALLFDMDNDGLRDIFVANGIYKDLLDRDYLTYTSAEDSIHRMLETDRNILIKLVNAMPSTPVSNYAFKNEGSLRFSNKTMGWNLNEAVFTTGSAYGDLDNDGDLDLVLNNVNGSSIIYQNNSDSTLNKSISLSFSSNSKNRFEIGTHVEVYCNGQVYVADNFVSRGFQSSISPRIVIGLGSKPRFVDSLLIHWPDGGHHVMYKIPVTDLINIDREALGQPKTYADLPKQVLNEHKPFLKKLDTQQVFRHRGHGFVDFNRNRMLPFMYSNENAKLCLGDIDNDKVNELYVCGGKDQIGVFVSFSDNSINFTELSTTNELMRMEETNSILFDADNDGDVDLYLASGGRLYSKNSSILMDKLLINDGNGGFTESSHPLPFKDFVSTSVVLPIDFDRDGDLDLVIGERFHPFDYGVGGRAFLFENNGAGKFTDITANSEVFNSLGMITDAVSTDIDNDGWMDIVMVGDWMPVTVLKNNRGNFVNVSSQMGFQNTRGWWNCLVSADLNHDGLPDFIAGNHGLNSFFKAKDRMYVYDFDGNGAVEQVFCTQVGKRYYPVVDKDDFVAQMPGLKKKLLYYKDYANMAIDDLFSEPLLSNSKQFEIDVLSSVLLLSGEKGYSIIPLPVEAQYSSIYSLKLFDVDKDGITDLLAGGNQFNVKPQFGKFDGSFGWFFKGKINDGKFSFESGRSLGIKGQIRDIEVIEHDKQTIIIFSKYDDELEFFKVNQ